MWTLSQQLLQFQNATVRLKTKTLWQEGPSGLESTHLKNHTWLHSFLSKSTIPSLDQLHWGHCLSLPQPHNISHPMYHTSLCHLNLWHNTRPTTFAVIEAQASLYENPKGAFLFWFWCQIFSRFNTTHTQVLSKETKFVNANLYKSQAQHPALTSRIQELQDATIK